MQNALGPDAGHGDAGMADFKPVGLAESNQTGARQAGASDAKKVLRFIVPV